MPVIAMLRMHLATTDYSRSLLFLVANARAERARNIAFV